MGQIAEDILDGTCCQLCCQYFRHPKTDGLYVHEYPVVCWDCWERLTKKERKEYQKAEVKTF